LGIIPEFAVTIVNRDAEDDRGSDKTIVTGVGEEIIFMMMMVIMTITTIIMLIIN
jgi:hypothetical protein